MVNLQSDARKEFKGSIARRTPQAWKNLSREVNQHNYLERNTLENKKRGKTEMQQKK